MPAPHNVFIARTDAYQRIQDESCDSPGRETGGILVGRMFHLSDGPYLVVVAASGPGGNADRRSHTYAPDTLSRQQELERWRTQYAAFQVDYVGEWHKHPPGMRQLSTGDTLQVIDILSDDSYKLPDGIFTPLVTIEDTVFYLHTYYYPRETLRPVAVTYQVVDDDITDVLTTLSQLEAQAYQQSTTSTPRGRWGVDVEALRAERANLQVPMAEVVGSQEQPRQDRIIDQHDFAAPPPKRVDPVEVPPIPPFPGPPSPESIPEIAPLPSRAAREQHDLAQFCATRHAQLVRHVRDDGAVWYSIHLNRPISIDSTQISPTPERQTEEGVIISEIPEEENLLAVVEIHLDPCRDFPQQPPEMRARLSDDRWLRIHVNQLFPYGWRSHLRLRDALRALMDTLSQPRAPQELSGMLEFYGRIAIRHVEVSFRTAADICADLNRNYSFQQPETLGTLDEQQPGV
ncbi:hypothetical protein OSCT_0923 [Oscillochloris trichoides DG-6]|uniref:JAB domain-containing protein n=1 Tax=Oscillochloris trichoides DG-6 TaxID=765420 RepID=E1IC72_9CHLR|nr:hypothetical protein [Oscillochloris trichoides]EFO81189.1 hypothetical protein OSCT_0923 [Oscillochloris trichoides DG-6]